MYTYNVFVFDHDLSTNHNLNNQLHDYDCEFRTTINKRKFEINLPYHGGQVSGDTYSVIFGTIITDSDHNKHFTDEIRSAKKTKYTKDYKLFINELKSYLISQKGQDQDFDEFIDELLEFIKNNKPRFYQVEVSS